jgi:hypothetical protein
VDAALNEQRALFCSDLVERLGLLRSQVEEALAELVAKGSVTADSFTGSHALLTPSPKQPPLTEGKRRRSLAPYSIEDAGRWIKLLREVDSSGRRLLNDVDADKTALERLAWIPAPANYPLGSRSFAGMTNQVNEHAFPSGSAPPALTHTMTKTSSPSSPGLPALF